MQKRNYKRVDKNLDRTFSYKTIDIDSYDIFEEPLEIIVTNINYLSEMGDILNNLGYVHDTNYFFHQCRDIISVPEKHINNKGQGKFAFQAYFHNFPDSVLSINKDALVVIVLHPQKLNEQGKREYNVVGYIHVNLMDVHLEGERYDAYYYNMLRVSERVEENKKIYRRKKIFTLMFSIMHSIVGVEENVAFTYGAMGKENQAINEALELNTKLYEKHYEKWAFINNTKINKIFGSKTAFKKCIDISDDKEKLIEFYHKLKAQKEHYTFYHLKSEEDFLDTLDKIFAYSKSTRIYMVPDANGNMDAACLAINWGEFFAFQLENPQGLFKAVAKMKLTDNILYPIMITGTVENVEILLKGIASHYNKQHGCKVTNLNSYAGDPYQKIKSSALNDEYLFLIICNDVNKLNAMKERSKGTDGNVKLFIDVPLL
ncbi:MAG TPA: hypothetical protein PLJ42_06015 [Chitinophagales bacterium]|jgi:hypothetical protein|nr:hypothetical protein [Chitinophagales bacterium]HQW78975.1 hypothetical protein [Chitinophagales bacterium]HRB66604.1 hypothetical protein [Chitinophagales bacterium]